MNASELKAPLDINLAEVPAITNSSKSRLFSVVPEGLLEDSDPKEHAVDCDSGKLLSDNNSEKMNIDCKERAAQQQLNPKENKSLDFGQIEELTSDPTKPLSADVNVKNVPSDNDYTSMIPDGGRGWIVCAVSFWCLGTIFGINACYGFIYVKFKSEYQNVTSNMAFKAALLGSLCTGLTFLSSLLAGILSLQIGQRILGILGGVLGFTALLTSAFVKLFELYYFTYGILLSIGAAFGHISSVAILGHYFKKKLGLVLGIATFGGSFFAIIFSQLLPKILDNYGLKNTFLILSSLYLVWIPLCIAWRPLLPQRLAPDKGWCKNIVILLKMKSIRKRRFLIWIFAKGISAMTQFVPSVHVIQFCKDSFPNSDSSFTMTSFLIASAVSRLVAGVLVDVHCVKSLYLQQAAFAIFGITVICIPFVDSFSTLIIFCIILGLCEGIFVCMMGLIVMDLVGVENFPDAFGFQTASVAVPIVLGPALAGLLYDKFGNYSLAFHVFGIPAVLGALGMLFISFTKNTEIKQKGSIQLKANLTYEQVPSKFQDEQKNSQV